MSAKFDTASRMILASVQAGCSIEEAARAAGVAPATCRRWLSAGRKGREAYAPWASALDAARGERKQAQRAIKDAPLSPEEADLLLARAARKGSIPALRLWLEMRSRDDAGRRGDDARALIASVFGDDDAR